MTTSYIGHLVAHPNHPPEIMWGMVVSYAEETQHNGGCAGWKILWHARSGPVWYGAWSTDRVVMMKKKLDDHIASW